MKHNMNRILTTMALLVLTTITAWAEQKVKITVTPENSGTVTYEIVNGSSVKLTCKPGNGYWLSKDYIKAVTSLDGGAVQAPQKRIPVDEGTELTITDGEGNTDVAGETTYYFDLPADQNLNVEVTATFQSRTSIEGATVTVVYPDGGIIYNGEEQKPAIASVVLAGTTLTSADYTVSGYSNNINVGNEAEVTVEGQGKYTGSATGKFTISKADLSTVTVGAIADQTFNGAEIKPAVTVTFNGKAVAEDEYSVAYSDNINAGTATVTLTSKDKSFSTEKTKTATFKIVAKALTADMVADIAAQAYTGSPLTPAVTVTDGDAILVVGEDYAVSYADNVNVGVNTATATVTGMGNYTGSVVKTFSISAVAATVKKAPEALNPTYTASAQDLVAAGETDNGKVVYSLTADGTFTETIPQATEAGSYTVYYKATGDANHTESAVGNVTAPIAKADLSTVTVGAIADQTFNGAEIKPAVTVTFNGKAVAEDEYSVAYSDNINAGTATVTLTSKDKSFSTEKTKTATFKIVAKALTADMVADIAAQAYTGSPLTPAVTVTDGDAILVVGEDYAVSYADNVNVGIATATITGEGNYKGTASKTFTIDPKELTADMVTLSPEKVEYNGATQKPEVTVADGTALTANDYTIENNGGVEVGKYDVVVTAKGNYTGVVTKQFEIVNRKLKAADVTFSENWASFYHPTENIDLPEGVAAYVLTAVGETTATATQISYIPAGVAVLLQNNVTTTTTNTSAEGNLMFHADEAVDVTTVGGTVYGLYNGKLMRVASGTIPAGKNFLVVSKPIGAPQLTITTDNTTAIEVLENAAALENSTDEWFTLDGRKLQQKPAKSGLYIRNGKKVVVNNK